MLVDVRDESTDDVRIVLELKQGADPNLVMAYLYKHTPLETGFHVNLTCLFPTENREIAAPVKVDLAAMLREFLDLPRADGPPAVRVRAGRAPAPHPYPRRLRAHLRPARRGDPDHPQVGWQGRRRRQALEALRAVGRADRRHPGVEALQAGPAGDQPILAELAEKKGRAKEINTILGDKRKLLRVVRSEITEVAGRFEDKRRTRSAAPAARRPSSSPRTSSSTRR